MPRTSQRFHYDFIHNVFGHFMENTLEYFGDYLYPRFEHQVVATYSKAVEYFTKGDQYQREHDKPNLPALILNPSGEFNLDDANSAGAKQLWRFPNLAPGLVSTFYEPIYQDNNNIITVGHTRLKGEIELLMLLNSFYEYCDVKILLIQMFGGEGRPIEPVNFNSFIIIPEDLYNYEYSNDATGLTYTLDWDGAGAEEVLVKTTNKNEMVVNGRIKPRYLLRGMSDNSSRYGGVDDLADWKLTAQIEYEIELPSFMVLESDYIAENIRFELRAETAYTTYDEYAIPGSRSVFNTHWDSGLSETENSEVDLPDEAEIRSRYDLEFRNRYFHIITQGDVDATSFIEIEIPEIVTEYEYIIVNSKNGPLTPHDHYTIHNSVTTVKIDKEYVTLEEGDIIEVYVYKKILPPPIPVEITATCISTVRIRSDMQQGIGEFLAGTAEVNSSASLLILELVEGTSINNSIVGPAELDVASAIIYDNYETYTDTVLQVYASDSYGTVTCLYNASGSNGQQFNPKNYYGYIGLRSRCGRNFKGICTETLNGAILFDNVEKHGAILREAKLHITSGTTLPVDTGGYVDVYLNAIDNASYPIDYAAFSALDLTAEFVNYEFNNPVNHDGTTYIIDITDALNEVMSRPGWVSGNDVMAVIKYNAQTPVHGMMVWVDSNPLQFNLKTRFGS